MSNSDLYLVILDDGTNKGPASKEVLRSWLDQGVVLPETIVRNIETGVEAPCLTAIKQQPVITPPPVEGFANYPRTPKTIKPKSYGVEDMLIPVRADIFAVAAGYAGLFACVIVGAPFAVLFGIIALYRLKRHPERTGKGRAWFGIIVGTVMLALTALALAGTLLNKGQ